MVYNQHGSPALSPSLTEVIVTVGADTFGQDIRNVEDIYNMESFDPLTNQWKTIGRTPLKVSSHAVVMSGESINFGPVMDPF